MLTLHIKQTFTDKITSVNKKKYKPAFAAVLLLQLFWSLPIQLFAQGWAGVASCNLYQPDYVKTPEASKLITHVTYPVNYSTGAVNISIPLFTVECGSLKLPISLSYNTTGLKVDEPSGWGGEGWTLHAEPAIVRNVNSNFDNIIAFNFTKKEINRAFFICCDFTCDDNVANENAKTFRNDTRLDQYYYSLVKKELKFAYVHKLDSTYYYSSYPFNEVKATVEAKANIAGSHFVLNNNNVTSYFLDGSSDYNTAFSNIESCRIASKIFSSDGLDSTSSYCI